ncbi:hypothetical protein K443DRAFT_392310 [Laccaria amethystina LaAM-08-1]|uniref:Uncharacterized protein n=1 Tax=Laccaria amethystina LaAM-08-1 TaxID=1095629 RepID=A0A0C9YNR0_9AGAR|nr:hypothetical protein K443DRAFT_392310 [Laccaria amethystina LaAM-08-1]
MDYCGSTKKIYKNPGNLAGDKYYLYRKFLIATGNFSLILVVSKWTSLFIATYVSIDRKAERARPQGISIRRRSRKLNVEDPIMIGFSRRRVTKSVPVFSFQPASGHGIHQASTVIKERTNCNVHSCKCQCTRRACHASVLGANS